VALRNLSVKGALIESTQKCGEVGEKVRLSFTLPCMGKEEGEVIQAEAFVRNVSVSRNNAKEKEKSAAYLCGVEFGSLSQLHQLVLQNFTYEAAFSQRQSIV
jgi:c-di-GMP-binding flagellar brake protein YcgR